MENWCVDIENPRIIRQAQAPGHVVAKVKATHTGKIPETSRFIAAAPETARRLAEAEARIGELEKMRDLAIKSAMSVLESGIFCQSDWLGILETLEFDEADYHTYADGIWPP